MVNSSSFVPAFLPSFPCFNLCSLLHLPTQRVADPIVFKAPHKVAMQKYEMPGTPSPLSHGEQLRRCEGTLFLGTDVSWKAHPETFAFYGGFSLFCDRELGPRYHFYVITGTFFWERWQWLKQ